MLRGLSQIIIIRLNYNQIGKYHTVETDSISHLDILIISAIFLTVPVTMVIWGKILVLFGILSKSEAKGYPWTKPCKKIEKCK